MKNFKAEYNALVASIINEIVTLLNDNGVTELTIFEGHPYDDNNYKDTDIPLYYSYHIYDDEYHQLIQKIIKVENKWGFVLFDENENTTFFPKELTHQDMKFECAETLYRRVYKLLKPKKVHTSNTEDCEALAKLKAKLEQQ